MKSRRGSFKKPVKKPPEMSDFQTAHRTVENIFWQIVVNKIM